MPALHSKQLVMRFSSMVSPPFEKGTMWSTTSFAPSCGVLPQYWHVKLSLLRILNRNAKWFLELFIRLCLSFFFLTGFSKWNKWLGLAEPLSTKGSPANVIAFANVPKWLRYAPLDGKFDSLFESRSLGLWPNTSEASTNLDSKYAFVKPVLVFILKFYRGFICKSIKLMTKSPLIWGFFNAPDP